MAGSILASLVEYRRDVREFWNGAGARLLPWYFATACGRVAPRYVIACLVVPEHDMPIRHLRDIELSELWRIVEAGLQEHAKLCAEAYTESAGLGKILDLAFSYASASVNGARGATLLDYLIELARRLANVDGKCMLCARECRRTGREGVGACNIPLRLQVDVEHLPIAVMHVHASEEAPLVPSTALYLPSCNMRCIYCQNWDTAHYGLDRAFRYGIADLPSRMRHMLRMSRCLKYLGGEPALWLPQVLALMRVLVLKRIAIPQVIDTNLLVKPQVAKIIAHMFDLVVPDYKYGSNKCAQELSIVPPSLDYVVLIYSNIRTLLEEGANVLVRHLAIPHHVQCCSLEVIRRIAKLRDYAKTSRFSYTSLVFNLLDQYRPDYLVKQLDKYRKYRKRVSKEEIETCVKLCKELGIDLPFARLQVLKQV